MFKNKTIISIIVVALISVGLLPAQDPDEKNQIVQIEFKLVWPNYHGLTMQEFNREVAFIEMNYLSANSEVRKVSVGLGGESPLCLYEGALPITFFKEQIDAEGELIRVPVLRIGNISSSAEQVIILVNRENNGQIFGNTIDFSPNRLPEDHIMLCNLSKYSLAAEVGESRSIIGSESIEVMRRDEYKPYKFKLRLASRTEDNSWQLITSKARIAVPGSRQLGLMYFVERDSSQPWRVKFLSNLPMPSVSNLGQSVDRETLKIPRSDEDETGIDEDGDNATFEMY